MKGRESISAKCCNGDEKRPEDVGGGGGGGGKEVEAGVALSDGFLADWTWE